MEAGIQDLGDSKSMKKRSARKRSQGFKKKEREKERRWGGGNPSLLSLCCQEPAHLQYKTHKNIMASLAGGGRAGKDPKHRLGPGLFGKHL